jgi:sulfoxide reductase heme-binding subunit YedZ
MPWRDRHGRFLPLKAAALALCLAPGAYWASLWAAGQLGGRAWNELTHASGLWAIRFVLAPLAVTTLARALDWPRLLTVRRMAGVTAAVLAGLHLLLYVADQKFALWFVASEIAARFYLTIGFVALLGLAALGATSTDAAVKRMGRAWKRLHLLAYPIGVLALWHYFLQSKANVSEAVFAAGIFAWLLLWRAIPERARRHRAAQWAVLPLLAVAAPLATAGIEFAWYALATNINPWRVLAANQSIEFELRPAHWIFAIAAARRLLPTPRRVSAPRSSDPIRARTANGS